MSESEHAGGRSDLGSSDRGPAAASAAKCRFRFTRSVAVSAAQDAGHQPAGADQAVQVG